MILHVCDRCGRKLQDDKIKKAGYPYIVAPHPYECLDRVELCERCIGDLDRFMKGQTVFAYGIDIVTSSEAD